MPKKFITEDGFTLYYVGGVWVDSTEPARVDMTFEGDAKGPVEFYGASGAKQQERIAGRLVEQAVTPAPWWKEQPWDRRGGNVLPMAFEVLKRGPGFTAAEVGALMIGKSGKWDGPVKFGVDKQSPVKAKARVLTFAELDRADTAGVIKAHGDWEYWKMTLRRPKHRVKAR